MSFPFFDSFFCCSKRPDRRRPLVLCIALLSLFVFAGVAASQDCVDWKAEHDPLTHTFAAPAENLDLFLLEDGVLYTCGADLIAWDIYGKLENPVQLGSCALPVPAQDLVRGDASHLYLACGDAGVLVFDDTDPSNIRHVGTFEPGPAITGLAATAEGMLGTASDGTLYLFRYYEPENPRRSLSIRSTISGPLVGRYVETDDEGNVLVAGDGGVMVFRFRGPRGPQLEYVGAFQGTPDDIGSVESIEFGRMVARYSLVYFCARVDASCDDGVSTYPCSLSYVVRMRFDAETGTLSSPVWQPLGDSEQGGLSASITSTEFGILVGGEKDDLGYLSFLDSDLNPIESFSLAETEQAFATFLSGYVIVAGGTGLHTYYAWFLEGGEITAVRTFFYIDEAPEYSYSATGDRNFQFFRRTFMHAMDYGWAVWVVDVRDPENISTVFTDACSAYNDPSECHDLAYRGSFNEFFQINYTFFDWYNGQYIDRSFFVRAGSSDRMYLPSDPVAWGGRSAPNGSGDIVCVLEGDGTLRTIDMNAYPNYTELASVPTNGVRLRVSEEFAFLIEEDAVEGVRLVALDLSDPANPLQCGTLSLPEMPEGFHDRNSLALLRGEGQYVSVDLSDPYSPVQTGSLPVNASSQLRGMVDNGQDLVVQIKEASLEMLGWSGSGALSSLSEFSTEDHNWGGAMSGNLLYMGISEATSYENAIQLYDLTEPLQPQEDGRSFPATDLSFTPTRLSINNDYLVAPGMVFLLDCDDPVFTKSALLADGKSDGTPANKSALGLPFPNPFNPRTTIAWNLTRSGPVKIAIYDVSGRLVRTLVDEILEPGPSSVVWNGTDKAGRPQPSGVYFIRANIAGREQTRKAVLLK